MKYFESTIQASLRRLEHQRVLKLHVPLAALNDWCIGLQLLSAKLIDAMAIRAASETQLRIGIGATSSFEASSPKKIHIELTADAVEYVMMFFLKYFRDGYAEVDHIDIEVPSGDYITFSVDDYAAPLSAEELRRRFPV